MPRTNFLRRNIEKTQPATSDGKIPIFPDRLVAFSFPLSFSPHTFIEARAQSRFISPLSITLNRPSIRSLPHPLHPSPLFSYNLRTQSILAATTERLRDSLLLLSLSPTIHFTTSLSALFTPALANDERLIFLISVKYLNYVVMIDRGKYGEG